VDDVARAVRDVMALFVQRRVEAEASALRASNAGVD
jgi:hypothetical protein